MTSDAVLLLTQWLSPGFPVGAFAYSHGLETAIEHGYVLDGDTLRIWLEDILMHGGGASDVILLAAAFRAESDQIAGIDETARAFAASAERLMETVDQGAAFARTVDAIWQTNLIALTYPVAVGRAARLQALPLDLTAQMYLHAFAANLVSAAVRLVPLGQTTGQKVLAGLADDIRQAAAQALTLTLDDLTSTCFAGDIAAMQHETQYSRVFRT